MAFTDLTYYQLLVSCYLAPLRGAFSGDDTPGGNIRSHTEHGNEESGGRWYLAGDGPGEQVIAGN